MRFRLGEACEAIEVNNQVHATCPSEYHFSLAGATIGAFIPKCARPCIVQTWVAYRYTVLTAPSVMPMLYRMSRESLPALIPDPGGLDQTYTCGMPALERGQKTCRHLGGVLGSDSCLRIPAMLNLGNFHQNLDYSTYTTTYSHLSKARR